MLNRLSDDRLVTTLQQVELGVLGPLQVRQYGLPVTIPGAKPRAVLTMLGLHGGSVVSADTLLELLWGDDPPRTAAKALQTHISTLRRTLGDGFVLTEGAGWKVSTAEIDATRYKAAAKLGREAAATGDASQAVARFDEALALWRGVPELPDGQRGVSEKTRWIEGQSALVEDRADALLATGRAAEIIGELEAAIADAPLRERRWGQLMLALYRAGRQGEALGAYQRARSLLADELGVDPGPDLRRLEAAIVAQDAALEVPVSQHLSTVMRAVTFLLTDIEGSTVAWEADADAMAVALARHDELVEQVVTSRGGRLVKTRGEGDATFSVFDRPSTAAAAAIELQEAIRHEPWALHEPMRIRVALHTGEVELRDGDYFGRAVNRAARLRSLAAGDQILCSGATAELVVDTLPDDVVLTDLGMRQLKNLARAEHVFELRLENVDEGSHAVTAEAPLERPTMPSVLAGQGPFVGRVGELAGLLSAWETALSAGTHAVLIAGEPGVGKTRLAGEWARQAYELGAIVLYGRCDEDLGAPYQPFAEALRSLVGCLGIDRLRGLRGVKALLPLIPGLSDDLPDLVAPTHADADTERYALFDAVVALLGVACTSAPVVLILDDLHWAAKPTLLLLRHLLRFGEHAPVQVVGTYRSTDLDRSHPLAAMLADLHRDGSADRLALSGLDQDDITAYVTEAGYEDEELARALASVTGGNPFFLIEALRHVDESGGHWDPRTLPQGVREAVSRRLSRLPDETNSALAAAAVVGSRFSLDLVERVTGDDLIDAFDEARKAGIVIEEPGGRYRFNHALVRQSLLAELASVRRMRLHQRIAATLEADAGADDESLAELAYHYFECAWAGNAAKAVEYCRRAADQAMARLAYEGAAELYDRALHALEELDEELPDRDDQQAELLIARCEALLAAGDVVSAARAVSQLQAATRDSARLAAWGTCFHGQLSMLTDPERLDDIEAATVAAAEQLAGLDDAAGEAKAHTVRAACLARLGRIGDCETALDQALTAARQAGEHRRVNNVLANAPLAALWGPNPVPRAGGRCLDVVRLLRITTGSPVVEATSMRCQGVLDALRGRAAAGRRLIDSARRTLTELGMRHALLEVEQFAGIVEMVADDSTSAEPHLRRAYDGFRRMGLDADTAETAALLARTCLALDRDTEADELCTESERLAGHALKASIAWRSVRALLLARNGDHDEAKRVAEEAVSIAAGTDLLVDHGDACLALATVLSDSGDVPGARAAAERAVSLYETKGAAALADKARSIFGERELPTVAASPGAPTVEFDNACVRVGERANDALNRDAWQEAAQLFSSEAFIESRRRIVGFTLDDFPPHEWPYRRAFQEGGLRVSQIVIAVRGEHLALCRLVLSTEDVSPGAPSDEFLQVYGIDEGGRIALQVFFDLEDIDAALAELDAAHARFEEQPPRLPIANAASRADERFNALFADRNWEELGALLADDIFVEDRRRGLRWTTDGRASALAHLQEMATLGLKSMTSTVVVIRGERLALVSTMHMGPGLPSDAFQTELLRLIEIDAEGWMVAHIVFDPEDLDSAIEELDARYLVGEAAPYASNWRKLADTTAALNRHESSPTWHEVDIVDHRRIPFGQGDFGRAIEELWTLVPDASYRVAEVHALNTHAAVVSLLIEGTDAEGSQLHWARILVWAFEQARVDVYEENDLDAALARFEELRSTSRGLENAASRMYARFRADYAAHDWDALAEKMAEQIAIEDRRRGVNAGTRFGRAAQIEDLRAIIDVGADSVTWTVIAIRGERLILTRDRWSKDQGPEALYLDALTIAEIDTDERIVAAVIFDADDIDAAIEELDARYLAGEAAEYASTWSAVAQAFSAINRHELPATTADWVNIDHRRATSFAPGEMTANIRASWKLTPGSIFIENVHRLDQLGAVVTYAAQGGSDQGFQAEWRGATLLTIDGYVISRCEIFDEADIDTALATFDKLNRQAPKLGNTASRVNDRYRASFAAHDWNAISEMIAETVSTEDRRRVVSAPIQYGRDAHIANMRAAAGVKAEIITSTVIATRGERLLLSRAQVSGRDQGPDTFFIEALGIIEIDADERIVAQVVFDPDDLDAAFAELDARYLAGEAAPYAHTWSVLEQAFAALNRHEFPEKTPDCVSVSHRRMTRSAPGDLSANIRVLWGQTPDVTAHIESVHRLDGLGAVFTHRACGTSQDGFDAEWRMIDLLTVEGHLISRYEIFDEDDIDAALARFDELHPTAPRLENMASRVNDRYRACFAAHDWKAISEMIADNISTDDRRRVVNAPIQYGRDAHIADMQAMADVGAETITSTVIATRGDRLILTHAWMLGRDQSPEAFRTDALGIIEIDAHDRIVARIAFEPDDLDAAFEELDNRYLAGEAAPYANTWSAITRGFAALNNQELPATTPDWTIVDRRRLVRAESDDMTAYLRAARSVAPHLTSRIEAVHRLNASGVVVTYTASTTSTEGFDAEWRLIDVLVVEGDRFKRTELFDESDLDIALARFDELSPRVPRLENKASHVYDRFGTCFAGRDWDTLPEILADDIVTEDRRRVVNSGLRHGREAAMAEMAGIAEFGVRNWTADLIATRGQRLALSRVVLYEPEQTPEAYRNEFFDLVELGADNRIVAIVAFDSDDRDAAFEELDARYAAGEAAAYAHTWSVIAKGFATLNRREVPATTADWVDIDHRRVTPIVPGDLITNVRESWGLAPDVKCYVEVVHRLSDVGAVFTWVATATSEEDFEAEWRAVNVLTVEDELFNRSEIFDDDELDAALTKFDELSRPRFDLANDAIRIRARLADSFNRRDMGGFLSLINADGRYEDRRKGLRDEGPGRGKVVDALFEAPKGYRFDTEPVAVRGTHLGVTRDRWRDTADVGRPITAEHLTVTEVGADGLVRNSVLFDPDDINGAIAELTTRWIASGEVSHPEVVEAQRRFVELANRHEWEVLAARNAGAAYVDHRQLARGDLDTMTDHMSSILAMASLVPNFWIEFAEVLTTSAAGLVTYFVMRGTSTDGVEIELPTVVLTLLDGERATHIEAFEPDQRDVALARFRELNTAS